MTQVRPGCTRVVHIGANTIQFLLPRRQTMTFQEILRFFREEQKVRWNSQVFTMLCDVHCALRQTSWCTAVLTLVCHTRPYFLLYVQCYVCVLYAAVVGCIPACVCVCVCACACVRACVCTVSLLVLSPSMYVHIPCIKMWLTALL